MNLLNPHSLRIMVADDEPAMLELVCNVLAREGFIIDQATDGAFALELIRRNTPDLAILDLLMPRLTGLEVCRALRSQDSTARMPLIMISARTDEVDRIVAFEVGVDDYLTKPFSPRELMLRVKAILRTTSSVRAVQGRLALGEVLMDEATHTVLVSGEPVVLTAIEYRLLRLFLTEPNRVHSRAELLERIWGHERIDLRTIDTQVRRLRTSLGSAARQIETIRAFGYRMTPGQGDV